MLPRLGESEEELESPSTFLSTSGSFVKFCLKQAIAMPVDYASPAPNRRGATPPGGVSTIDLFSWSEGPDTTRSPAVVRHNASNDSNPFLHATDQSNCESPVGRPTIRMHQVCTMNHREAERVRERERQRSWFESATLI